MEWIVAWVRNIACLYLILSVIGNFLPDVEEKKYIQFFGSILVTICLLRPLLKFGDIGERLEQNVISNVLAEAYDEMQREVGQEEILGAEYVRQQCEQEMERQVRAWLSVYGCEVLGCEAKFSGGEVMELENLNIKVKKGEVEEDFLKNELRSVYNIPLENININIQG